LLVAGAFAQQSDGDPQSANALCTFTDGKEISVEYNNSVQVGKEELPLGKVWLPGGYPITLFTQIPLTIGNAQVPVGAYRLYVIPNKKDWTLIVSKNVTAGAAYDEKQDLVRAPMELGQLSAPAKQLQVSFAHMAPKLCSLRFYVGKIGAFADFQEK
jgi:hypothetical protein